MILITKMYSSTLYIFIFFIKRMSRLFEKNIRMDLFVLIETTFLCWSLFDMTQTFICVMKRLLFAFPFLEKANNVTFSFLQCIFTEKKQL